MKIGFDISDLATNRADGTTRYTLELAKRLPRLGYAHQWLFFTPFLSAKMEEEIRQPNVKILKSPWPRFWTQCRLPVELYRYQPNVLLMPIQQLPIIRPANLKTVAVVHDLAVHNFSQQFTYKTWALLHAFSAQVSHQADEIIAVSDATAKDIDRYYGRSAAVTVVPHGIDTDKFRLPLDEQELSQSNNALQKQLQVKKPFILFVGQIQPRKNIVRLIQAFNMMAAEVGDRQLVIAGGHGWLRQTIIETINKSPYKDRIQLTGAVDDLSLRSLYWGAEVFVLPSLYEGFGMPILEAMSCGCPVVTSNNSSMPEVAGGAAVLVKATDVNSIKQGIEDAIKRKEELRQKGRERIKMFSWEETARLTLAVIER